MQKDIPGGIRKVIGFNKIADEDGDYVMVVEYNLKLIDLYYLKSLFNVGDDDPYCIDPYDVNEEQAKVLQPYVINGFIDLDKYFFELRCYQDPAFNEFLNKKNNIVLKEIPGAIRQVIGFNKVANADGNYTMAVEYNLKPMELDFLKTIFEEREDDPYFTYFYDINEQQAKALQPYVIDGVIDLDKYLFELRAYKDPDYVR